MPRRLACLALALLVTGCCVPPPKQAASTRPSLTIVTREQWGSKPQPIDRSKRQTPRIFTIHHAGELWKPTDDPFAKMIGLQRYGQTQKGWPDVPYHYLVAPDGRVFEGRDWHYQPETNTNYSLDGVMNIELMGNFEEQRVSIQQLRALVALLAKLSRDLHIDPATIRGHRDAAVDQTVCPGRDFYRYIQSGLIREWVEQTLAGHEPSIRELPELPGGPTTRIAMNGVSTHP